MARFPKIQSPCPYKANLADYLEHDVCRMCKRQVHNLSAMSDSQRENFLSSCSEQVCVTYKLPARAMLGAALIATSLQYAPAAASEFAHSGDNGPWLSSAAAQAVQDCDSLEVIMVGGIKNMSEAQYIDTEADLRTPEIPVIYDDNLNTEPVAES